MKLRFGERDCFFFREIGAGGGDELQRTKDGALRSSECKLQRRLRDSWDLCDLE